MKTTRGMLHALRMASLALWLAPAALAADAAGNGLVQRPAMIVPGATDAMMLGATRAGRRIVAVGDHGVVLLSDDDGATYRQARAVPTRATLTGATFTSDREGWAVGHWGVILHTSDGGDTWTLQRDDIQNDRPLWTVWFQDAHVGLAAGLWGLVLRTDDGGAHWQPVALPPTGGKDKPSDYNLLALFSGAPGHTYIAAEHGTVFRSDDAGQHWSALATGGPGTFWTGTTLKSGALLVAGLRGHVFRSEDGGAHWSEVSTGNKSSITAMAQLPDGKVVAVGMDGVAMQSLDDGHSFAVTTRANRESLTALAVSSRGQAVVFSEHGPVQSGGDAATP